MVGPTSSGKTLFWLLPLIGRMNRDQVTVVVVPLSALLSDLLSRALEKGVDAVVWSRRTRYDQPLVFISVESAVTDDFGHWVNNVGSGLVSAFDQLETNSTE